MKYKLIFLVDNGYKTDLNVREIKTKEDAFKIFYYYAVLGGKILNVQIKKGVYNFFHTEICSWMPDFFNTAEYENKPTLEKCQFDYIHYAVEAEHKQKRLGIKKHLFYNQ